MAIQTKLLNAPQNRFVSVAAQDSPQAAFQRLQEAGGDLSWHLLVPQADGRLCAIRFEALAKLLQEDTERAILPLSSLQLPEITQIDGSTLDTRSARAAAQGQPTGLVAVTRNQAFRGLLFEGPPLDPADTPLSPDFLTRITRWMRPLAAESHTQAKSPTGFEAFPRLDTPEYVDSGATFEVTVGFRADLADGADPATAIRLSNLPPEAALQVTLVTDGARLVEGPATRPLPARLNAAITYRCRAQAEAKQIRLTAQYQYDAQVVGVVTRILLVSSDAPRTRVRVSNPFHLGQATPETRTDLLVTLTRSRARPGYLQWTFASRYLDGPQEPVLTEVGGAREFAATLIRDLRTQNFTGPFAAQILENKGQDIADIMPTEFFDALAAVAQKTGAPPTLLLLSDENYIPWELALLDRPLDPEAPPFLGAQTDMGRWLLHEKVAFPPVLNLTVERFTAVAHGYGLGTNQPQLQFALDEQEALIRDYQAVGLLGVQDRLQALIAKPYPPNHLVHFAVHGVSDPQANDQALLLGDNARLIPSALVGRHRSTDAPLFNFVFLNACQVGTAGDSLGQAAGFPGDLIRGGIQGLMAPLWNVDDAAAQEFAKRFYAAALQQQQPVSRILREYRRTYMRLGHTTPLAYVFYGHPNVILKRA